MSHVAYSPVGYIYQADHYCLDCIPSVVAGTVGYRGDECNCAEHQLDRIAAVRGINRYDERSFDSCGYPGGFPKAIPYHNDLHCECGPEHYGYGPDDSEWREQYCGATCAKCHEVIDGTYDGGETVCPVWLNRKENGFE